VDADHATVVSGDHLNRTSGAEQKDLCIACEVVLGDAHRVAVLITRILLGEPDSSQLGM